MRVEHGFSRHFGDHGENGDEACEAFDEGYHVFPTTERSSMQKQHRLSKDAPYVTGNMVARTWLTR
jgi:hypothetical protein